MTCTRFSRRWERLATHRVRSLTSGTVGFTMGPILSCVSVWRGSLQLATSARPHMCRFWVQSDANKKCEYLSSTLLQQRCAIIAAPQPLLAPMNSYLFVLVHSDSSSGFCPFEVAITTLKRNNHVETCACKRIRRAARRSLRANAFLSRLDNIDTEWPTLTPRNQRDLWVGRF